MNATPSIIERAFELATSGRFTSVAQIEQTLKSENYEGVRSHLGGRSIRQQIKSLIAQRPGVA